MTQRTVTVDGIPFEVSDSAAAAINKLTKERDEATQAKTAADAKLGTMIDPKVHADAITAKDAQIAELKKDVMTPAQRDAMVADWGKMIGDAKKLAPEVITEGKTCLTVRKEVIAAVTAKDSKAKAAADAVLGGKAIDTADADTVRAVFNVLVATSVEDVQTTHANDAQHAAAALVGKSAEKASKETQLTGRDAMLARQAQAWNPQAQK